MDVMQYRLYSSLESTDECASVPLKWAEIDLSALRSNYRILRERMTRRAPASRLIAVVKADAYGHGAKECVRALLAEGCDFFAVSCIEEALPVRRVCEEVGKYAEILILGYTFPDMARVLFENQLTQALISPDYADVLASEAERLGICLRVHVAVDTGMNRIGFPAHSEEEIATSAETLARLSRRSGISIVGMYTHMSRADGEDTESLVATRLQTERYLDLKQRLERFGVRIPFHHICNSAAVMSGNVPMMDGVRMGILLYGAQPALWSSCTLLPVMRLCTRIIHTYSLLPGERVGYGGAFCSDTPRVIAVLPIGYADGLLRSYRDASVCVHSVSGIYHAPIVGRICMDQCMIDVTGCDAAVGDTVTLFGTDGLSADWLAQAGKTIDYEVLCLISARVPRLYLSDSEREKITEIIKDKENR